MSYKKQKMLSEINQKPIIEIKLAMKPNSLCICGAFKNVSTTRGLQLRQKNSFRQNHGYKYLVSA